MIEGRGNCRKSSEAKVAPTRKGPWLPEEDEILLQYVRQFGARDWSSIRSKGLLPRTGKSCRLRWVNKLKPDLKSGCKFSPEEERIVIDLQGRFGNKWARIATYLPGRTDNDVKNFWSTREKKLAKILHASSSASHAPPPPPLHAAPHVAHQPPNPAAVPDFTTSGIQPYLAQRQNFNEFPVFEATISSLDPLPLSIESQSAQVSRSCKTNCITMVPLLDLVNAGVDRGNSAQPQELMHVNQKSEEDKARKPPLGFQFDTVSSGGATLGYCNDNFSVYNFDEESLKLPPINVPIFDYAEQSMIKQENLIDYPLTPDSIFDDFPADMFNYLEPIQMPTTLTDWSSVV